MLNKVSCSGVKLKRKKSEFMVICTYQSREKTKVWENSTFERLLYGKS